MKTLCCKLKSYIQPFEKKLALKELSIIADSELFTSESRDEYIVKTRHSSTVLAERLTYWESVCEQENETKYSYTLQVRREATTNIVRNGIALEEIADALPFSDKIPLHNRRNLRYGTHGIHEYRGKFFPQLVKSLLNVSGATKKSNIFDAMCGSGTTLVESSLIGANSFGIDQNPLSVFISRTKCELLQLEPQKLSTDYSQFRKQILNLPISQKENRWLHTLNEHDKKYLSEWFSSEVLSQLDQIMICIESEQNQVFRQLLRVSLSNILRNVSWQKNDDLRVRKEIRTDVEIDVIAEFLGELGKSVRIVLAFLYENNGNSIGISNVYEGDARYADKILKPLIGKMDINITSPPYATALPYLDTDRLSLYYLGIMNRSMHREKDYGMIGNREVTNKLKRSYLEQYATSKNSLTQEITTLIDTIHKINDESNAGFRRKNLSSLLAKYFLDMKQVFESHKKLLRKGGYSFFVVGNNHTVANGERIEIKTDELLAHLGEKVGFYLEEVIPMELLLSRDIFKKNAGNTEKIIVFRNL